MLQRDDRPGGLGRPSLFSEATAAPGEDKNILKQLDGLLAASGPAAFWTRQKGGLVGGLLAVCALVAGLVWMSGRDQPAPVVAQAHQAAPAAPAPASFAAAAVSVPPAAATAVAPAGPAVPESPAASAAPVSDQAIAQAPAVDKPRGRSHRHAARVARDKPATAAERREHKTRTRHAAETHGKARGKDKPVAAEQRKAHGKRHQDTHGRSSGKHGTHGKAAVVDSDAALLEAVITHGRATGAIREHPRAAAAHCSPAKGGGKHAAHPPATCKTHTARNKAA